MLEKPPEDQVAPPKSIGEEDPRPREDQDEPESEEEQRSSILFTPKQLEVLFKMGRLDFGELVATLKTGATKGERFQPAKPGNFDGARDRKVVDAWLAEMDDYIHAAMVGRNSAVELDQSYLKGYVATWWWTVRQEEGKNHGYTWEFFKDRIEVEFIPRNSDYISRCKLRDLVNATNENLRQYVRAYSELMLEVRHMHEMDPVCQFVMGLPTWAKRKLHYLRPSRKWRTSRMWGGVTNPGSRRTTSSFTKSQGMRGNGTGGKVAQPRKSPNNFKARGSSRREVL
jgi:hypothetical protein